MSWFDAGSYNKTNSSMWPINLAAAKIQNKNKYVHYFQRPEFELYDIVNAPLELINHAHQPKYSSQIVVLKNRLAQWMMQQGDQDLKRRMKPVYTKLIQIKHVLMRPRTGTLKLATMVNSNLHNSIIHCITLGLRHCFHRLVRKC